MNDEEILKVIEDLIETARDGAEGYRLAAESTEDHDLKRILQTHSGQRQAFVSELQGLAAGYGGDVDTSSSAVGSLHRGWMNLKQALSSNDRAAILEECQRGDEHAIESYEDALESPIPASVQAAIRPQADEIRAALAQMKTLADLNNTAG